MYGGKAQEMGLSVGLPAPAAKRKTARIGNIVPRSARKFPEFSHECSPAVRGRPVGACDGSLSLPKVAVLAL
jgi:hypothetical protein